MTTSPATHEDAARRAAERAARESYGKLVAFLAARTRDVAEAEDALSEAFAAALRAWPRDGTPEKPEAWLLTAARRKLVDARRREGVRAAARGELARASEEAVDAAGAKAGGLPDERLGLLLACSHPAIDEAARAPLMLQTVLGLDAARIAAAFLVSPSAMAQRLVRAKRKIRDAGVPFAPPDREAAGERVGAALQAVYAAYAEGWSARGAGDAVAGALAEEALYLARLLAALAPDVPEALGLLALLLHLEARRPAGRDASGAFTPLDRQDTRLWSVPLIDEAEETLRRAALFAAPGRFQIEAAIQSAHAERRTGAGVNWRAIVGLYDGLLRRTGSPVVAINRAAALGEAIGPAAGLAALEPLSEHRRLAAYQPYWAVRARLLARCGDAQAAAEAYDRAAALAPDPAVRRFLMARKAELDL